MGGVLGIWQLIYIMVAVPCGAFLDRVGARRALFVGALIIAGSGMLRGVADGVLMLYLAVGLFGVGGPIVSAGAPKVIARWFKGSERGLAMGMYITGPNLGAIVSFALTNSVLMPALDNDWRLQRALPVEAAACGARLSQARGIGVRALLRDGRVDPCAARELPGPDGACGRVAAPRPADRRRR